MGGSGTFREKMHTHTKPFKTSRKTNRLKPWNEQKTWSLDSWSKEQKTLYRVLTLGTKSYGNMDHISKS